jgi:hypothetical protein
MSPEMASLTHAVDVICEIKARLEATGGTVELYALQRFSVDELDLLVRLELGLANGACTSIYPQDEPAQVAA